MDISSNGSQYACYTLGGVTEKTPHHYQTRKGVTQTENMLNVPESFFFFFLNPYVFKCLCSLSKERLLYVQASRMSPLGRTLTFKWHLYDQVWVIPYKNGDLATRLWAQKLLFFLTVSACLIKDFTSPCEPCVSPILRPSWLEQPHCIKKDSQP